MKILLCLLLIITIQSWSAKAQELDSSLMRITGTDTIDGNHLTIGFMPLDKQVPGTIKRLRNGDSTQWEKIITAAIEIPADIFFVDEETGGKFEPLKVISVSYQPKRVFMLTDFVSNGSGHYPFTLEGDISESRANELIDFKFDPAATIRADSFFFHGQGYRIITRAAILKELKTFLRKGNVISRAATTTNYFSNQLRTTVLNDSRKGGRLDFFTAITGKKNESVLSKSGIKRKRLEIALYNWGKANAEAGIQSADDALYIYSELRGRNLTDTEQKYIRMGFNKGKF